MNKTAKRYKMKFISILIFVEFLRCAKTAPSSSDSEYNQEISVEHKTKRSADLMNILNSMLMKYSGGVESAWPEFSKMFNYGYETNNWNSYGNKNLQSNYDNNFIENSASSDNIKFRGNFNSNSRIPLDSDCPELGNNEIVPIVEVNYQYNEFPRKENWNTDGRGALFQTNPRKEISHRRIEEHDYGYGPNSGSVEIDWNEAIPSQGNIEIDELISKNFYLTPPKLDTSNIGNSFLFEDLTPTMRKWETQGTHFATTNGEVQDSDNSLFGKGTKFNIHTCYPEPDQGDMDDEDERRHEADTENIEDEYLVLLIKKAHVVGDRRQSNTTETRNHQHGEEHTETTSEENVYLSTNHIANNSTESNKTVSDTAADEDVSFPFSTTHATIITESTSPNTRHIVHNSTELNRTLSNTIEEDEVSSPHSTTCATISTENFTELSKTASDTVALVGISSPHSTTDATIITESSSPRTSHIVNNSTEPNKPASHTTKEEDLSSPHSSTLATIIPESSSPSKSHIVTNSTEPSKTASDTEALVGISSPHSTTDATSITEISSPSTSHNDNNSREPNKPASHTTKEEDLSSPHSSTLTTIIPESFSPSTSHIVNNSTEPNETVSDTTEDEDLTSPRTTTCTTINDESTSPGTTQLDNSSTESGENYQTTPSADPETESQSSGEDDSSTTPTMTTESSTTYKD